MNPSRRSERPQGPRPARRPWRTRRALIAVPAILAAGGGIALAVALQGGGQPSPPAPRPTAAPQGTLRPTQTTTPTPTQTTTPTPKVSAPRHNPRQSPPWGFTGGGWLDICYGPVASPGLSKAPRVPAGRPCRPGSTRLTGATQIALTARAGADTDRIEALWSAVEPLSPSEAAARGVPRFNWAPVVSRYRTMVHDGIRPIVVAYGSPPWAHAPVTDRPGGCAGCTYPPTPQHVAQWRAFVRGLMAHLPKMGALEIWNEPNYAKFFAPHPDPGLYARLLRAADDAAHESHFHRPILTGGLSPGASPGTKMPPAQFLARVYEIAGERSFDGIGAHPYPSRSPWAADMTASLERLRRVSERFGDGSKPLWITEVGIGGSRGGEGHFNLLLDQQGVVLARMYRAARGLNVRSFLIYTLSDLGGSNRFATYGVLTPALRPKPAYCYLGRHVGGTSACPVQPLARAP